MKYDDIKRLIILENKQKISIDNIVDVCSHIIDFNFTLSLSSSVIVQILKLNLNIHYADL